MAKKKTKDEDNTTKPSDVTSTWADPKTLGISDRAFFKPEDGKTKRIKLLADPVRAHVQFVNGLGFIRTFCEIEHTANGAIIVHYDGSLDQELIGREPQLIWMAPVLVYDTDKKGQVGGAKAKDIGYEIQLWSFYTNDYKRLYQMVVEWGIDDFNRKDLLITGVKKGKYINADFAITAKTALYLEPGLKTRVDDEFAAYQYRDANRWIAREVTEDELREAIGATDVEQPKGKIRDVIKRK